MGTMEPPPCGAPAIQADRIGNAAHTLLVGNQTININGRLEWIQTMEPAQLQTAEKRLRHAAVQHELRAILPIMVPAGVTLFAPLLVKTVSDINGWQFGERDILAAMALAATLFAFPVWLNFYDTRRRNRRVVEVAERRLAEVIIELALRQEPPPRIAPGIRAWRWLKAIRARRRE